MVEAEWGVRLLVAATLIPLTQRVLSRLLQKAAHRRNSDVAVFQSRSRFPPANAVCESSAGAGVAQRIYMAAYQWSLVGALLRERGAIAQGFVEQVRFDHVLSHDLWETALLMKWVTGPCSAWMCTARKRSPALIWRASAETPMDKGCDAAFGLSFSRRLSAGSRFMLGWRSTISPLSLISCLDSARVCARREGDSREASKGLVFSHAIPSHGGHGLVRRDDGRGSRPPNRRCAEHARTLVLFRETFFTVLLGLKDLV